jgi:hypothetical protein
MPDGLRENLRENGFDRKPQKSKKVRYGGLFV